MHLAGRIVPALMALLVAAPGAAPSPASPGLAGASAGGATVAFTALEPGLELGLLPGPPGAPPEGKVWIVRVDPARFELRLLNASASDGRPRSAREWALGAGAVVAINAGMYQTDGLTSVGLMRTRGHQNNPHRSARFKAALAFDPLRAGLPKVSLLDAECGDLEGLGQGYGTLIQSIRMISCDRRNVWAQDGRRWSAAAIGIDGAGRLLLVHSRAPWAVHDLVDALLAAPLDLRRAMYVEGGPEAQLFLRAGGREVERLGAFEGAAGGEGGAALAWEIPNVVVAVRRAHAAPGASAGR